MVPGRVSPVAGVASPGAARRPSEAVVPRPQIPAHPEEEVVPAQAPPLQEVAGVVEGMALSSSKSSDEDGVRTRQASM